MDGLFIPRSAAELEQAVQSGAVGETAYLDFKEFPQRTDGVRKGFAKDIAAMSIDGGVLILGVQEPERPGEPFRLAPQVTQGWREWASQIALNTVRPPIRVTTAELNQDEGVGYVVIVIPPSARAPHMVDGRYWGRADSTNAALGDEQVRRLWSRNLERRGDAKDLLSSEIARDPTPEHLRDCARLFFVAQPASADSRLFIDTLVDRDVRRWLSGLAQHELITRHRTYNPGIHSTSELSRRAHGAARSTYEMGPDRVVRSNGDIEARPGRLVDVEVREDGGVRYLNGRASDELRGSAYVITDLVVGEVSVCIELVRVIAETAGFHGSWTLGAAVVGLKSTPGYSSKIDRAGDIYWPYSEDVYEEMIEASWAELVDEGSPVLDDLMGRFCRGLHSPSTAFVAGRDVFPRAEPAA